MPGRVLIVTGAFPPVLGGGAIRNAQTAAGLAERGWSVTVLTTDRRSPFEDLSLLDPIPPSVRVVRAREPGAAAVGAWFRRGRMASSSGAGARAGGRLRRFLLTWALVPDAHATWIVPAIARGRRLVAEHPPDALLTSGPPHSAHLVGLALSRGRRWIVDSQDPWARTPYRMTSSALRRWIDDRLEALVVRRARITASATASQTEMFRAAYPDIRGRFVTLPSGYDEREFRELEPLRASGRRILHVGSLYGDRTATPVLRALRLLAAARPELVRDVELLFAGWADERQEAELDAASRDPLIGANIRRRQVVPRAESLRLMVGSDVLLVLTDPGGGGRDLVPLKTLEYLRAGRPILAVVPEGETARILDAAGGALRADPRDVSAIARALERLLDDPSSVGPPSGIDRWSFDGTIDRLSDLLGGAPPLPA